MRGTFGELKQRRVIRTLVAYLVAAWVAIEVSSTIAPLAGLPDWMPRLVLVLVSAGLPAALILAWFFDFDREGGLRRAPDPPGRPARRMRTWALGGIATLLLALGAFGLGVRWRDPPDDSKPKRVVVAVFENRTGDEALAPLGHMASDWVTQGLTEAGFIEVADPQTAFAAVRQAGLPGGAASAGLLGREAGATLVVQGSYYQTGDSVLINAEVRDVAEGRVVVALPAFAAPRDDPLAAIEQLRQRTITALALQVDRSLEEFEIAPARPPSYAAYRAYVEGVQSYLEDRYTDAARHFDEAAAADSTFDAAVIWAAHAYWFIDLDSLTARLHRVESRRAGLSTHDRARLDWITAFRDGSFEQIYQTARQVSRAAPGSVNARRELALAAMRTWRYAEAREILDALFPPVGLMRLWSEAYPYYTELLHLMGEYEEEARQAREGERLGHLDRSRALVIRARAAAALGDTARARLLVDSAANTIEAQIVIGRELIGHGGREAGRAMIGRATATLEERPEDTEVQFALGVAYYALERYSDARAALEAMPYDFSWHARSLAFLARLDARDGNPERAMKRLDEGTVGSWWPDTWLHSRGGGAVRAIDGDLERAFEYVRAYPDLVDGDVVRLHTTADPDFAPLRGYPPFEALVGGRTAPR